MNNTTGRNRKMFDGEITIQTSEDGLMIIPRKHFFRIAKLFSITLVALVAVALLFRFWNPSSSVAAFGQRAIAISLMLVAVYSLAISFYRIEELLRLQWVSLSCRNVSIKGSLFSRPKTIPLEGITKFIVRNIKIKVDGPWRIISLNTDTELLFSFDWRTSPNTLNSPENEMRLFADAITQVTGIPAEIASCLAS